MSEVWELVYKCRMCGNTFSGARWFGDVLGNRAYDENGRETHRHECEDGNVGIGDIVGFRKVGDD